MRRKKMDLMNISKRQYVTGERLDEVITSRVSTTTKEQIKYRADSINVPFSAYINKVLLYVIEHDIDIK